MESTLFGAAWTDPQGTSAVLRAAAWAREVQAQPVPDYMLVGAVICAHTWCAATSRSSLTDTAGLDTASIEVASAALAATCGSFQPATFELDHSRVPSRLLEQVYAAAEEACEWAAELPVCYLCACKVASSLLAVGRTGVFQAASMAVSCPDSPHDPFASCALRQSADGSFHV